MSRNSYLQNEVLATCTECEGTGLIKDPFADSICTSCGGFGLIETEVEISQGMAKQEDSMKSARTA